MPNVPKARLSLAVRVHGASAGQRLLRVRLVPIDELISDDGHEVVGDDVRRDVALTTIGMTLERERMLWTPSAPTSSTPAAPQRPGSAVPDSGADGRQDPPELEGVPLVSHVRQAPVGATEYNSWLSPRG